MNTRRLSLTDADWERLSAYVDRALPPAERQAVEARLARDPAWQDALAELQALRRALRGLPAPPRPRSFVLSPAVARPRRAWWYRLPQAWPAWAGAMAVLVLALVIGWGAWSLRPLTAARSAPMESAAPPTVAPPAAAGAAATAALLPKLEAADAAEEAEEPTRELAAPLAPQAAAAEEAASPTPSVPPTVEPTPEPRVTPRASVGMRGGFVRAALAGLCVLGGLLVVAVGLGWARVRGRR